MGHHVRGRHGPRGRLPSGDARVNAEPAERVGAGAGGPGGGSSLRGGCGRSWSEAGGGGGSGGDRPERVPSVPVVVCTLSPGIDSSPS
ncbi:NADH dehydrogenase [ubiquinone] 1 beta subcomplex subunit 2, mitochondrial isoform X3 [Pongo abelii]|uniref:NADH dehydrogenase [ubiquinone] 1 beta subcomplex subunit 2, mitochondrial isoform X3 n=1 Tax=Pongo abelii TaxID=9601 RepID=UPI0023E79C92|nr:NADH dehydrogenase [ubiquinone] 1 beta subcomplex subunit 2, mitochondrial isoform X3 [Pongo abelii]